MTREEAGRREEGVGAGGWGCKRGGKGGEEGRRRRGGDGRRRRGR